MYCGLKIGKQWSIHCLIHNDVDTVRCFFMEICRLSDVWCQIQDVSCVTMSTDGKNWLVRNECTPCRRNEYCLESATVLYDRKPTDMETMWKRILYEEFQMIETIVVWILYNRNGSNSDWVSSLNGLWNWPKLWLERKKSPVPRYWYALMIDR